MNRKYLVGICSYNEGDKIRRVVEKFSDYQAYDVLLIDDGSDDGSIQKLPEHHSVRIIRNPKPLGAGYGTRQTIEYAQANGHKAIIFVSGNDKDDSTDVKKLITAVEEGYDFIQGSRYKKGGKFGRMPLYRQIATRFVHPWLFSLVSGKRITDSTNGFRAIRTSFFDDARLNINQAWLDQYELEPYVFYKAIQLKYRVTEVPVSKIYPPRQEGYSKMKPFVGWWSILRPLIYLGLGIRK